MSMDPFAVFGADDEDGEEDGGPTKVGTAAARPSDCGPLSFHAGTEEALYQYVQNVGLKRRQTTNPNPSIRDVLQAVDEFCYERHWMMHIGPDKGEILDDFLRTHILRRFQTLQNDDKENAPFSLLEIGTYCGYSSLRMAQIWKDCWTKLPASQQTTPIPPLHVLTVDVDPTKQEVARKIHGLVKDELDGIEFSYLCLEGGKSLTSLVEAGMTRLGSNNAKGVDFLFLDHEKELYLPDLQALYGAGLVRPGTAVAADNVVFFGLDNYREYVDELTKKGLAKTTLQSGFLEYTTEEEKKQQSIRDGLELTLFI